MRSGSRGRIGLFLVLLAAYAATLGLDATPGERYSIPEAHNLLVAESIVSDADVDLRDEYRERDWSDWRDAELEPRGGRVDGRLHEPQGIGFPLLIAPAYALAGPAGVELFLAALLALAFCIAAALGRRLVPEPWATRAALVIGLSPPALGAATAVGPEGAGAMLLAGAALLALRVRDEPRTATAFWCAALVAALPWLSVKLALPAGVVALALARWLRRRQRGLAGFVSLEVVLTSAVVFVTVNDRVFGGLTPFDVVTADAPGPTGAVGVGEHLERATRLAGLWLDRDAGLLIWAPFAALAFVALWALWRSRRDRLAVAVADQIHVEVAATFLALVCAATVVVAAFLAPALTGDWFPSHNLVPVLPAGAALAAWGLRVAPARLGAVLAVLTLAASAWLLIGARVDEGAALQPPRGALPWGGAQDALPRIH